MSARERKPLPEVATRDAAAVQGVVVVAVEYAVGIVAVVAVVEMLRGGGGAGGMVGANVVVGATRRVRGAAIPASAPGTVARVKKRAPSTQAVRTAGAARRGRARAQATVREGAVASMHSGVMDVVAKVCWSHAKAKAGIVAVLVVVLAPVAAVDVDLGAVVEMVVVEVTATTVSVRL